MIFGSSHHETRPAGGVLENFTMCAEKNFFYNGYIKSIFDPVKIFAANVHTSLCCNGFHCLNENGEIIIDIPTDNISFDKIRINHYFCKSKEEYIAIKMSRGDVAFGITPKNTTLQFFHKYDQNILTDTDILSRI